MIYRKSQSDRLEKGGIIHAAEERTKQSRDNIHGRIFDQTTGNQGTGTASGNKKNAKSTREKFRADAGRALCVSRSQCRSQK